MTANFLDTELEALSAYLTAGLGLAFPPARWADLERQINSAAEEFGYGDGRAFVNWLLASPLSQAQVAMLAAHLTIPETYFWREPQVFKALRTSILPALIRQRAAGTRRLRLWCAGCSTGEEVYSIAILLSELVLVRDDWEITLLATDINARVMQRAAAGVYGEWSFRDTPPGLREYYFTRRPDGQYEVLPQLRTMVTFAQLNLAEDSYPSLLTNTQSMDVIFCRNVLMYFDLERSRAAAQRLYQALTPGGWLVVAAAEVSDRRFPLFTPVAFPGVYLYRRDDGLASGALPTLVRSAAPTVTSPSPQPARVRPAPDPAPAETGRLRPATVSAAADPQPQEALKARDLAGQGKLAESLSEKSDQ